MTEFYLQIELKLNLLVFNFFNQTRMLVDRVNLDSNFYEMLDNHALSNEKEEIMGLLIENVCFCLL